jgi:glycerate kinase
VGLADYLRAMAESGAQRVVLGLGGTATVEGGASLAWGLGARFDGVSQVETVAQAAQAKGFAPATGWPEVQVTCWCDVGNPLLGPEGAAQRFAAQKGASLRDVRDLEAAMEGWSRLVQQAGGPRPDGFGFGAAGGLAYGLKAALGERVRLCAGSQALAELVGLRAQMAAADRIWTGEGGVDATTFQGKLVGHVLALAEEIGKPVTVFAGQLQVGLAERLQAGLAEQLEAAQVVLLGQPGETASEARKHTLERLERAAFEQLREAGEIVPVEPGGRT